MQTITINNSEIEGFISKEYGNDIKRLLNDFTSFIKTEIAVNDIKKGLDEVEQYQNGKKTLITLEEFLEEVK